MSAPRSQPPPSVPKRVFLLGPLLLGLISLGVTFGVWRYVRQDVDTQARTKYQREVTEITQGMVNRFNIYVNSLYGIRGLYGSSNSVERNEWKTYVQTIDVTNRYPGISAFSFIKRVPAADAPAFVSQVRTDVSVRPQGYPNFQIYPERDQEEFYPFTYIEPFSESSEKAMGFDISSEANRRAALEQARDTDAPVATAPVISVTTGTPSFSVLLPVYRNGQPHQTVIERRESLEGLVSAGFRIDNLFQNLFLLGSATQVDVTDVTDPARPVGIYATPEIVADGLMFDTTTSVTIAGRQWVVRVISPVAANQRLYDRYVPLAVLGGGIILSLLIFAVLYSFSATRTRALGLAASMTKNLQDSERKYRAIFESLQDVLYRTTLDGTITMASPSIQKYIGIPAEKLIGQNAALFYQDPDERQRMVTALTSSGAVSDYLLHLKGKGGGALIVSLNAHLLFDAAGKPTGVEGVLRDVTERQRMEQELHERTSEAERLNKIAVDRELKMVELKQEITKLKKIITK